MLPFFRYSLHTDPGTADRKSLSFVWLFACRSLSLTMSFKASGTLRFVLTQCLALSATILPVLSAPVFEPRAAANKCGGTGLYITNSGSDTQTFTVFGGGATYAMNSEPYKSVTVPKGQSTAVPLSVNFDGHVQRGNLLPATWVEFTMTNGASDGDVSLEIGCDGAAQVQASAVTVGAARPLLGFDQDILTHAPADAFHNPASGKNYGGTMTKSTGVLDATGTDATGVINQYTLTYEQHKLSQSDVYLFGGSGTNQAIASDNCLLVTFY